MNTAYNIVDNSLEINYINSISIDHRKKFAQFFTPYPIVELMSKWLLGNSNLHTILEPAFGLGIFSRYLLTKKDNIQIRGFEIDDIIFEKAKKEFNNIDKIDILLEDYIYNDWNNKYDGIICNPPYFKFHDYDNKNIIKEIEYRLEYKLNGFTNLYALFLLKSIYQLKPNGRCAYIVPSEFLNSDYGKLIKTYLLKTGLLRHIMVVDFEENIFDDALTTASIVLCAHDNRTDKVQFNNIKSINELYMAEKIIEIYPKISDDSKNYRISELDPGIKWKTYYQPQNRYKFKNIAPFSYYAKVSRGIATGDNNYFTFNISKAKKYNISEKHLLPCICKCSDVKENIFSKSDFEKLKYEDRNVFLLNVINIKDENIYKYIEKGKDEKIDKKYLTSKRNPWFSLENRPPAPIWVSVFNRTGLRFIRNQANISNLTTFHCVYPRTSLFSNVSIDLLFAYLLTDTSHKIFSDNCREYGNGLQKFEPNDLNNGKIIDINTLSSALKDKIIDLYGKFCRHKDDCFIKEIDNLFISHYRI